MDELSEARFALDEAVGHVLLPAKLGQVAHHLDGLHVVSDHDEFSLVLLDQLGHVVKSELDHDGLGAFLRVSLGNLSFGFFEEPGLLVFLGLGGVL